MRILFIGMPDSIHVVRWISQIADQNWDIYLFPTSWTNPHPEFRKITLFGGRPFRPAYLDPSVRYLSGSSLYFYGDWIERKIFRQTSENIKSRALAEMIRTINPDIIHSLEIQHAGYITSRARQLVKNAAPPWIATNWGSDIYHFRKMPEHKERIERILRQCDYYSCECERDIRLAREMGFTGKTLPVLPNAGGLPLEQIDRWRSPGSVSNRRTIIIKGYHGWSGRALVALEAVRICKDLLRGYSVAVYSASKDVEVVSKQMARETGVPINIVPGCSHEEMLRLFGRSRIYIGLGISDGISTSFLEAMAMGAFPIQSCTACADEWIQDGKGGFIVPAEDPQAVAGMLRRALSEDALVNQAAAINGQTVRERLEYSAIKNRVVQIYQDIRNPRKD
jgi:hypothetical protein